MRALLVVALLLVAAPVLAAEGEPSTFLGLPRALWKTANMLAFFGLLAYLVAKPIRAFFVNRREQVVGDLSAAERQQAEAARVQAEVEAKIAALGEEVAAVRERLEREGERERAALVAAGEADAARLLAQLDAEATRRVDEARTALAREAATVAAELAWELLEREITPADRERIFRATLERLRERSTVGVA